MTATYFPVDELAPQDCDSRDAVDEFDSTNLACCDEDSQPTRGKRRGKAYRRRQIDPTTCERDYSQEEIEFMQALDAYKRSSGRMFPTCSEILEVIRTLGYVRIPADAEVATG